MSDPRTRRPDRLAAAGNASRVATRAVLGASALDGPRESLKETR
jgi:hypothetical protein